MSPESGGERKTLIRKGTHGHFLGWWKCFLHHYFSGASMNVDIC